MSGYTRKNRLEFAVKPESGPRTWRGGNYVQIRRPAQYKSPYLLPFSRSAAASSALRSLSVSGGVVLSYADNIARLSTAICADANDEMVGMLNGTLDLLDETSTVMRLSDDGGAKLGDSAQGHLKNVVSVERILFVRAPIIQLRIS